MIKNIFPSLFGEIGAISAAFIGANVTKSHVNESCVIIKAIDGKPVQWFMSYLQAKGFDTTVVDQFEWRYNTDGSLSIFDKVAK